MSTLSIDDKTDSHLISSGAVHEFLANPFPGLQSFDVHQTHLFFGRERQASAIIEKLKSTHFVAVVGTSGTGKSSLIRAGVLPLLYGGFMPGEDCEWQVIVFRPGGSPLRELAAALLKAKFLVGIIDDEEIDTLFEYLQRNSASLVDLYEKVCNLRSNSQAQKANKRKLLLVVDQFEELFRLRSKDASWHEDAAHFINVLLSAADCTGIYVVATMRSEFIGACSRFPNLAQAVSDGQYLVPRMNREELKRAITGPIAVGSAKISPQLVARLLNEMTRNSDDLPVLQHALMRTFDRWAMPLFRNKEWSARNTGSYGDWLLHDMRLKGFKKRKEMLLLIEEQRQYDISGLEEYAVVLANRCFQKLDVAAPLIRSSLGQKIWTCGSSLHIHLSHQEHAQIEKDLSKLSLDSGNSDARQRIVSTLLLCYWRALYKENISIDHSHYEMIGTMKDALTKHGEEILKEVDAKDHELVTRIFKAVTVVQDDGVRERRPQSLTALANITGATEQRIVQVTLPFRRTGANFLAPSEAARLAPSTYIDLTHESLMHLWDKLDVWIKAEQSDAEQYKDLVRQFSKKRKIREFWRWYRTFNPTEAWASQYEKSTDGLEKSNFREVVKHLRYETRLAQFLLATGVIVISFLLFLMFLGYASDLEGEKTKLEEKSSVLQGEKTELEKQVGSLRNSLNAGNETNDTDLNDDSGTDLSSPISRLPGGAVDFCQKGFEEFALGHLRAARELLVKASQVHPESNPLVSIMDEILTSDLVTAYEKALGPQKTKIQLSTVNQINARISKLVPNRTRLTLECVWGVTGLFSADRQERVSSLTIMRKPNQILRKEEVFMPLLLQSCEYNSNNINGLENAIRVLLGTEANLLKKYRSEVDRLLDSTEDIPKLTTEAKKNWHQILRERMQNLK